MLTVSEVVFACHEKACAPPPAGKGGSSKGHGRTGSEYTNSEALDSVRRRLSAEATESQRKARAAAKIKPKYSKKNPPPGDPFKNYPKGPLKTRYNYADNE